MQMITAVVGVIVRGGRILMLHNSKQRLGGLITPPISILRPMSRDDASELEKLDLEFSSQLGVGFDFSKGAWGKVVSSKVNASKRFQLLPLKGELTKYEDFNLGPNYREYMWLTPTIIRNLALGPIFDKCLTQFGL